MSKKKEAVKPTSKGKRALNITLIVIQVALVIAAIAFSVSILLSTGYESNTDFGKSSIRLMPVLTGSMAGENADSFDVGDLIIVKRAEEEDVANLKVGDVITYLGSVGGEIQFVTHRIVDIQEATLASGKVTRTFYTMGDAETSGITKAVEDVNVQGVYVGKIPGVGSAVFWLQDPTHFFLVIMLPLILLLLYNAYLVVRYVMEAKLKKQREQLVGAGSAGATALDEEEIKRRAIEEYLKQKAGDKAENAAVSVEDPAPAQNSESVEKTEASAQEISVGEENAETDIVPDVATGENNEAAEEKEENDVAEEEVSDEDVDPEAEKESPATEEKAYDDVVSAEEQADGAVEAVEVAEALRVEEAPSLPDEDKSAEEPASENEVPAPENKPVKKPAAKKTATKTAEKKPAAKAKSTTTKTASAKASSSKTTAKTTAAKSEKKPAAKTAGAKTSAASKSTATSKTAAKPTTAKKAAGTKTSAAKK